MRAVYIHNVMGIERYIQRKQVRREGIGKGEEEQAEDEREMEREREIETQTRRDETIKNREDEERGREGKGKHEAAKDEHRNLILARQRTSQREEIVAAQQRAS